MRQDMYNLEDDEETCMTNSSDGKEQRMEAKTNTNN